MNNKKIQYSSISIVFTVVVIALILALNLFVTSIEDKLATKIDLSTHGLISISDATHTALKSLGDSFETHIYFLTAKDLLESSSEEKIYMVHELAKEYSNQYPEFINIHYKDLNKDMAFLEELKTEAQSTLSADKIVVKGKYHTKVYPFSSFFVTDEESGEFFAFQGELKFTSAILQTSMNEQPIALFTTGHGEKVKGILSYEDTRITEEYPVEYINNPDLYEELKNNVPIFQMLDNSGFLIKAIDLSKEDVPEDTDLIVISDPRSDFQGYTKDIDPNAKTEINKIDEFVNSHKSLVVIVGEKTPSNMPNLLELLWEEYGLGFESNSRVQDLDNCIINSSTSKYDGYSIVGEYLQGQKASLEYAILANVKQTSIKTIFNNPIKLNVNTEKQGAEVSVFSSESATVYKSGEVTETGAVPLVAVYNNMGFGQNNAYAYKRVFLVASTDFCAPAYTSGQYGNPYIFYGMARAATNNEIIPDKITYVKLENEALNAEQLTSEVAKKWAFRVSLYIPSLILFIGGIVWLRRRHL